MTSEIKYSHLSPAQVYELNARHGYFEYADAQGDVSRAFANDAVAAYLRVNEEAQAIMAEHSLSPRELLEGYRELREALKFYANPEVYEPDSVGRVPDLTMEARAALAKHNEV